VADYIGKLGPSVLMEAYAPFNKFITTVCYRDLTVILFNNTRVRTNRYGRRTYYKLGFGGRVVSSAFDNLVAFIKVKCRFNFRDNLKKSISKIYLSGTEMKFVLVKRNYGNIFEE
jgi:hypothetical protein